MAEYEVCEGFTVRHHGTDDWFPVVDAAWWEREWLGLTDECRVEVESPDGDGSLAEWGEVVAMLESLGNTGPYGEEPVFQALTYNHENDLSDELLIAAGWVDVSEHALHRGMGSPLLRAVFAYMPEHDWNEIGRVWIVATARGGCYGWTDSTADVYVSPNMDDDYDVARWQVVMVAHGENGEVHPIHDACSGFGDGIEDLGNMSGYPYGSRADRLPMFDVSDASWDEERGCHEDGSGEMLPATAAGTADGYLNTYSGPWLACGEGGVFAVGVSGRVYPVSAWVS